MKITIIGAGFSGATAAYLLKKKGHEVQLLESADHPGGGCWTRFYGNYPYTIGPRVFYTYDKEIFDFVNNIAPIREFYTKTCSYIQCDDQVYNYPLQYADIESMHDYASISKELDECKQKEVDVSNFENYWLSVIGKTLYEKFVKNYSVKMWGIFSNKELSANFNWVNRGTPIRDGDTNLFGDQYQGYPIDKFGYNKYFEHILDGINIRYNSKVVSCEKNEGKFHLYTSSGDKFYSDALINTGHTDEVFNFKYGELEFSGRDIVPIVLPTNKPFGDKDYHWIHYSGDEPYTRITDFNKVTGIKSSNSLITLEIPSNNNRLYPKQTKPALARYEQYVEEFPEGYHYIGRLGKYKYTGISDAIKQAFELAENF